ncbi:MAG: ATP-binding protein [Pseudomonadota bacterium]
MPAAVELAITGQLDNLAQVQEAVERFSEEEELSSSSSYALSLCLEELLTNIVMHAAPLSNAEISIAVSLAREGELVQVFIADDGPAYDPTASEEPDLDALLDDRPIGGLGIHLVRALSSRFDYRHAGGRNQVSITLPRQAQSE